MHFSASEAVGGSSDASGTGGSDQQIERPVLKRHPDFATGLVRRPNR